MGLSRVDKFVREFNGTNTLAEAASVRTLDLSIILGKSDTDKIAIMAHAALSIALRCSLGTISVCIPEGSPGLRHLSGDQKTQLREVAASLNATHRVHFVESSADFGLRPTLALGCEVPNAYVTDAAGWVASIGGCFTGDVEAAAPAAIWAVCCSFAKLFHRHVLGEEAYDDEQWTFSLLDFTVGAPPPHEFSEKKVKIGRVGLLGAGAIGSGFAYCLAMSVCDGDLVVIDRDAYEEPNFETTITLGVEDARAGIGKANHLATKIGRPGLNTCSHKVDVDSSSTILSEDWDIFVCAVDNAPTRCSLDFVCTKVLLNAAVGGSRLEAGHVLLTTHVSGSEPLSSFYTQNLSNEGLHVVEGATPDEISDECSRIAYNNVTMASPFLGLAAGALLAAACLSQAEGTGIARYVKFNLLRSQQNPETRFLKHGFPRTQEDTFSS